MSSCRKRGSGWGEGGCRRKTMHTKGQGMSVGQILKEKNSFALSLTRRATRSPIPIALCQRRVRRSPLSQLLIAAVDPPKKCHFLIQLKTATVGGWGQARPGREATPSCCRAQLN